MTYAKFGEKGEKQEAVWRDPLDVNRTCTDKPYLIAFGAFIVFWIIIAIYAFSTGVAIEVHYINAWHHLDIFEAAIFFGYNMSHSIYIILGFFGVSVIFLMAFMALFRWATKVLVYVTVVLMAIVLLLSYALAIFTQTYFEYLSPYYIIFILVSSVAYGMIMYAFAKVGVTVVYKVIKESCKALFFFPSTLCFVLTQFFAHLVVIVFTGSVYGFLRTIVISEELEPSNATSYETEVENNTDLTNASWYYDDDYYDDSYIVPTHIYFCHLVNFIGFFWATFFIMNLGRMVLTVTFATWYHIKDRNAIPKHTINRSFLTMLKYHAGTVAYGSSIMALVPMSCIIWKHGRDKAKLMYKRPLLLLSWFTMLSNFSSNALSMCAIHGKTYYKSAKESYILLMKNPMSYLVINNVSESIVFLGSLLIPFLTFLMVLGYCVLCHKSLPQNVKVTSIMVVTLLSILKSLIFFVVFRAASNTIGQCYLEDSKVRSESELNLYDIHIDECEFKDDSSKNIDVTFVKNEHPSLIEDVNPSYTVNIQVQ